MTELGETTNVELGAAPTTTSIERRGGAFDVAKPVYLTVEGIEMDRHPGIIYAIYLDAPGAESLPEEERRAGFLSFFGVSPDEPSAIREFDVTPVLERLTEAGGRPDHLTLTFVPTGLDPPEGQESEPGD